MSVCLGVLLGSIMSTDIIFMCVGVYTSDRTKKVVYKKKFVILKMV